MHAHSATISISGRTRTYVCTVPTPGAFWSVDLDILEMLV